MGKPCPQPVQSIPRVACNKAWSWKSAGCSDICASGRRILRCELRRGAALLKPVQRKKPVTCGLIVANRAFLLAIAALPLLPAHRQPWALVGLVALMNVPGSVGHISWQSLMGDTIPADTGRRVCCASRLVTAVGIVPALLGGYLFDSMAFPISDISSYSWRRSWFP